MSHTRALSGTQQVRMDVPGEKDFTMRGVCYSAVSYAPVFIGRTAVVVGFLTVCVAVQAVSHPSTL